MKSAAGHFAAKYCVSDGRKFQLEGIDPEDTGGLKKPEAKRLLPRGVERLSELQDKLYAQDKWAVLLIFQAMDAAGKDGTIKHVMSGVNPQGCHVSTFKVPNPEELDHDYLWRANRALPERGRIGVFNRSYYEEVLVVRVHKECLEREKIPEKLITKDIWQERFQDLTAYERYLSNNGVVIRKFFLHVSKKEQKKRIKERLENKDKNWKFAMADVQERQRWDEYMHAYQDAIRNTASKHAPWYVVPADHKWYTRLVVMDAIVATLEGLDLSYPKVTPEQKKELEAAREELEKHDS